MKKKVLICSIVILICLVGSALCFIAYRGKLYKQQVNKITSNGDNNFNTKFFKTSYTPDNNYLVSPYSVYLALGMLRDGANGNSYNEIASLIGSQKIDILNNDSVHIANAMFLKNQYKNGIKKEFTDGLVNNYKAELLYDSFETPDIINDWVYNETDGMIDKLMNDIDKDFVLGLANAIAIDVDWKYQFECQATTSTEFTNSKGEKKNVEMMHAQYTDESIKYLSSDDAKGIIIPYKDETNLEFVGILPNDSISDYVSKFSIDELNKLESNVKEGSKNLHINLSLPRFSYDFELQSFGNNLNDLGIKEVFDKDKSDLTNIMTRPQMNKYGIDNLYVSQAIHKTFIDLNEKGTKAAAVTFFGVNKTTSVEREQFENIYINFDKPFLYIIRDKNTKDILFIGTVESPNEWKGSTCKKEA